MNTTVHVQQEDRHAATRALWRAGQLWETLIDGETTWTPVGQGGRAEPLWDQHQSYRQCAPAPRPTLAYWPYCERCRQPFSFDPNEPLADCDCGTTEWGDPRPADWIPDPRLAGAKP